MKIKRKPKLKIITVTALSVVLVTVTPLVLKSTGLIFTVNRTESLPFGLYRVSTTEDFSKGVTVMVQVPEKLKSFAKKRAWLREFDTILKPVAATEGDRVCIGDNKVTINDEALAPVYTHDREGLSLPVIRGCFTVSKDSFFLLSTSIDHSFDGRYFGETSTKDVKGVIKPILTF